MESTITIYVKTLSGDMYPLSVTPSHGWEPIRATMATYLGSENLTFFSSSHEEKEKETEWEWYPQPDETIYVIADPRTMCLNMTTGEYFRYRTNTEYNRILSYLCTILNKSAVVAQDRGHGRWQQTDRIIIVPIHLEDYVALTYGRIAL